MNIKNENVQQLSAEQRTEQTIQQLASQQIRIIPVPEILLRQNQEQCKMKLNNK